MINVCYAIVILCVSSISFSLIEFTNPLIILIFHMSCWLIVYDRSSFYWKGKYEKLRDREAYSGNFEKVALIGTRNCYGAVMYIIIVVTASLNYNLLRLSARLCVGSSSESVISAVNASGACFRDTSACTTLEPDKNNGLPSAWSFSEQPAREFSKRFMLLNEPISSNRLSFLLIFVRVERISLRDGAIWSGFQLSRTILVLLAWSVGGSK